MFLKNLHWIKSNTDLALRFHIPVCLVNHKVWKLRPSQNLLFYSIRFHLTPWLGSQHTGTLLLPLLCVVSLADRKLVHILGRSSLQITSVGIWMWQKWGLYDSCLDGSFDLGKYGILEFMLWLIIALVA